MLLSGGIPVVFVVIIAAFQFGLLYVKVFSCKSLVTIFGNKVAYVVREDRDRVGG